MKFGIIFYIFSFIFSIYLLRLVRVKCQDVAQPKKVNLWKNIISMGRKKLGNLFCVGKPDGNYANPDDCASYIACGAATIFIVDCPEGLVYNRDAGPPFGQCVWDTEFKCSVKGKTKRKRR